MERDTGHVFEFSIPTIETPAVRVRHKPIKPTSRLGLALQKNPERDGAAFEHAIHSSQAVAWRRFVALVGVVALLGMIGLGGVAALASMIACVLSEVDF